MRPDKHKLKASRKHHQKHNALANPQPTAPEKNRLPDNSFRFVDDDDPVEDGESDTLSIRQVADSLALKLGEMADIGAPSAGFHQDFVPTGTLDLDALDCALQAVPILDYLPMLSEFMGTAPSSPPLLKEDTPALSIEQQHNVDMFLDHGSTTPLSNNPAVRPVVHHHSAMTPSPPTLPKDMDDWLDEYLDS